jgi:hypothetical protein
MLTELLKHWGLYVALLILFGPIVLIWAIEPDWVARVIGTSPYYMLLILIPLHVSITRKRNYFGNDSPIYKWFNRLYVDIVVRALLFLFGVMFIYGNAIPFVQDLFLIINQEAPLRRTAYVAHTRSLSGNISEEVILDTYPNTSDEDDLTAWYFTPRHIMKGNTYTFLILPHSRIIVEAIPVEIINR